VELLGFVNVLPDGKGFELSTSIQN